ncbi:MAG: lysylphosphatidylglycerol synthase transmembrane domain-containing protein [Ferruginibacter sp.]
MRKRLLFILQSLVFLAIGIFLVWWSIHKLSEKDYREFINSLKNANYYLLIPVFLILVGSHLSRAIRWKILMESMNYKPKLSNTFCAVMIGYLANFAFPRLGEVLKCTILGKYEKVPPDKLVGTILIERAVDVVSFFIIIIISLLTQANIVGAYTKAILEKYIFSQDTGAATIKILVILLFIAAFFILLKYVFKKFHHIKYVQKIKGIFKGIIIGLSSVKNLKNKWLFIFHSVLIWSCYAGGTYLGFYAITETSGLPVLAAFPVLVFGTVATMITPGGIGLYPVFVMEAMTLYSIPESFGTANGWLQWSAQFFLILIVGFICLLILPYLNKSKNEISQQHTQ